MLDEKKPKTKLSFVVFMGYPLYNKRIKSELFGGGAGVQIYLLSKEFAKNSNFDTTVITGNYKFTKNKIELWNNLRLFNIRPFKRKLTYYFLSLLNFFIVLIRLNPDVVIQRGGTKNTGICAFYCKLFKKKFIFSIANITDVNGEAEKGFFGRFYKYGLNNAHHIVAQNKEQILELTHRKRKIGNICLIKSSYEVQDDNSIKKKEHILWVARAINWKRPELFIELAKKFHDRKFIMICNKTDTKVESIHYWNRIYNKAKKIRNLEFFEFIPFHKINEYFKTAKVFVNTSTFEGFPNTFIQAFQNRTPVLSLKVNPEGILNEYNLGFDCNNSFDKMVKNLSELLENRELYNKFSENCYEYFNNFHNIKNNMKLWIKLIIK
ncbi:MAG: glycosyltransferase family 4 protein [Promethearchaeota archaeon]